MQLVPPVSAARRILGLVALLGLSSTAAVSHRAMGQENLCSRIVPSVALIVHQGEHRGEVELGAGTLIDAPRKLMVTAAHVVGDARSVTIFPPVLDRDGQANPNINYYLEHRSELGVEARVVAADPSRDIAIVQLDHVPASMKAIPLAEHGPVQGDRIFGIGHSGTDDDDRLWSYRDCSVRIVCHKRLVLGGRNIDARMFETTIASNHGDSGGPMVNSRGELIGVTVTHHGDSEPEDAGQKVGYCTDVSEIRVVLGQVDLSGPLAAIGHGHRSLREATPQPRKSAAEPVEPQPVAGNEPAGPRELSVQQMKTIFMHAGGAKREIE